MKWMPLASIGGSILMPKLHMASPWHQAGASGRIPCYFDETTNPNQGIENILMELGPN